MSSKDIYLKLKAETDEEILLHFPKRYDDLSVSDLSFPLFDNQKVVIFGSYTKMLPIQGGRIIRLTILSERYKVEINATLFNQPFYMRVLKKGRPYFYLGVYKEKQKTVMLTSILSYNSPLVTNRYKPYYALPSTVSQSSFYELVLDILSYRTDYINDVLPKELIGKYKFEDRLTAFKDVHIPVSFENVKRGLRVFKYEEALKYCLYSLYTKGQSSKVKKGIRKPIDKEKINEFIKNLPYKLTLDQVQAIREIIIDMEKPFTMNRLLQGDVGTGKTIVAFICMYANYLRGGQSVLLAPTSALASQHYQRALEVFKRFDIKIVELDSSLTKKQEKEVLEKIKDGDANFIIGTHSVFNKDVVYNKLTLAVIDEQHKFGVDQREEMVTKGEGVDLLSMSATPIPRTLSMIINSDLDVSFLNMFPHEKREVVTKRVTSNDPLIYKAIHHALDVHKQVFVVAPKIEKDDKSSRTSSKLVYEDMVKEFGEDNVSILTGKTKKDEQEAIYSDFSTGKKLILVSTSLIEVGVDIKNAALMVIYEANYFGLASLHQLRGRIGRKGEGALALLVYDGDEQEAIDKLDYLCTHVKGEDVAMYDLSNRGSGDLLSSRQSGDSMLRVANFVTDFKIFECAKKDAVEILSNLSSSSNQSYLNYVLDCVNRTNKIN